MKFIMTYEVNLFGVFAEEKMKYHRKFTVTFDNKKQQLQYAMEGQGVLTVKFGRDNLNGNKEDFYYSREGNPDEKQLVYQIADNGRAARFVDEYLKVPKPLRDVVESYRVPTIITFDDVKVNSREETERDRMGIEKAQSVAKKHKKLVLGNKR